MPEVRTQTKIDPRASRREARQRRMHLVTDGRPATVKVYPANDVIRQTLRHSSGVRFREQLDQPVEWPNDSFTSRRIAEGAVRTDGPGSEKYAAPDAKLNARQQSAARSAKPQPTPPSDNQPESKAQRPKAS